MTANTAQVSPLGRNLIIWLLAGALLTIFATSAVYRIQHPSNVKVNTKAHGGGGMSSDMGQGMDSAMMKEISEHMKELEKNPNDPDTLMHLASEFLDVKAWDRAAMFAKRAQVVLPEEKRAYIIEGIAFFNLERHQEAVAAFEKGLALDVGDPMIHYNLGILKKYYLNRPDDARTHFQAVIDLKPKDEQLLSLSRKELEK